VRLRRGPYVPAVDEPAEDELATHDALLNWAEWCRVRLAQGRAQSAEGRYLAPAGNVYNPPEPRAATNVPRAEKVNAALLEVPRQHRDGLRWRYYLRAPDRAICRALALRPSSYGRFMRDARLMLRNILHFRGSGLKPPFDNSTPPSTDESRRP